MYLRKTHPQTNGTQNTLTFEICCRIERKHIHILLNNTALARPPAGLAVLHALQL